MLERENRWCCDAEWSGELVVYGLYCGNTLVHLAKEEIDFKFPRPISTYLEGTAVPSVWGEVINHCKLKVIQTVKAYQVRCPCDLWGKGVALIRLHNALETVRQLVEADRGDANDLIVVENDVRELLFERIVAD
jgi:hypothetical protein